MEMGEMCAVWVMTEESLKPYLACVLVPFVADRKGGIFNFKVNTTKSRQRTVILSSVSLQSFIYTLVFIPLQYKHLVLSYTLIVGVQRKFSWLLILIFIYWAAFDTCCCIIHLILVTVWFKGLCMEGTNFWHGFIYQKQKEDECFSDQKKKSTQKPCSFSSLCRKVLLLLLFVPVLG